MQVQLTEVLFVNIIHINWIQVSQLYERPVYKCLAHDAM